MFDRYVKEIKFSTFISASHQPNNRTEPINFFKTLEKDRFEMNSDETTFPTKFGASWKGASFPKIENLGKNLCARENNNEKMSTTILFISDDGRRPRKRGTMMD